MYVTQWTPYFLAFSDSGLYEGRSHFSITGVKLLESLGIVEMRCSGAFSGMTRPVREARGVGLEFCISDM